ncbi:MAG: thioredoxin domain-containing protein [Gemmatimonadetes bacterium]|nr:thioredoxin domain-containing protein [Gemmatimonadota bacterium]
MDTASLSLTVAFAAGLVSFLSPCVLPLVPSYLSLVTGLTLDELSAQDGGAARRRAVLHSGLFTLGFGAVFMTMGLAATGFGQAFGRALPLLARIGGVVIVVLGLHLLGVVTAPVLNRERRANVRARPASAAGSVIAGLAFGAGWTPCIGPILASILLYSTFQSTLSRGMLLLGAYTLGLAVPFIVAAVGFNWFLSGMSRARRWAMPLERGAGAILVIVGLLMVADRMPAVGALAGDRVAAAEGAEGAAAEGQSSSGAGGLFPSDLATSDHPDAAISLRMGVDLREIGYAIGEADAPVTVVEFSDFGCPYCRMFAMQTFPSLYNEFVRAGTVRWKYVPFVLGIFPHGEEAAYASECAGEQERFALMHDQLYEHQSEWKGADVVAPLFEGYAEAAGLDVRRFTSCVQQGRRNARTLAANRAAQQLGIRGTPTFFIEGQMVQGAIPLEPFREFLAGLVQQRTTAR